MKNCMKEVMACVNDPNCKAALDCLEDCPLNDQVRPIDRSVDRAMNRSKGAGPISYMFSHLLR